MFAAAAQPFPICSPFLPRLSLRRLPPRTLIIAAAAAKIRSHRHRRRPIPPSREATADEDALGAAPVESEAGAGAVDAETGGGLKGSDVLRALQRAVAAKEEASPRRRKKKKRRQQAERVDDDDDDGDGIDLGSIRPVEIRSDWGPRIEELERRVEELQQRQHY